MQKQYFKVTDLENRIICLIETSREGGTVVASHNAAADRVSFTKKESFSKNDFTGKVDEITIEEYADGLTEWGYEGSVIDAVVAQNAEAAASTGDEGNETSTSTDAGASAEAPTQPDAVSTESYAEAGNVSSGDASEPTLSSGTNESQAVDSGEDAATAEGMPENPVDSSAEKSEAA